MHCHENSEDDLIHHRDGEVRAKQQEIVNDNRFLSICFEILAYG